MIQNPLQTQSMRHTGLDPVSPASLEGFKINSVLCNPSNYATLNQVQSDRRLLPLIGEGRDGECPARALFFFVILNSGAGRNVIQNPLHWEDLKTIPSLTKCSTMRL